MLGCLPPPMCLPVRPIAADPSARAQERTPCVSASSQCETEDRTTYSSFEYSSRGRPSNCAHGVSDRMQAGTRVSRCGFRGGMVCEGRVGVVCISLSRWHYRRSTNFPVSCCSQRTIQPLDSAFAGGCFGFTGFAGVWAYLSQESVYYNRGIFDSMPSPNRSPALSHNPPYSEATFSVAVWCCPRYLLLSRPCCPLEPPFPFVRIANPRLLDESTTLRGITCSFLPAPDGTAGKYCSEAGRDSVEVAGYAMLGFHKWGEKAGPVFLSGKVASVIVLCFIRAFIDMAKYISLH